MNSLWLLCSKISESVSSKEMLIALHLSDLLLQNKITSFPTTISNELLQQAHNIHQNELQKMPIRKKPEMKNLNFPEPTSSYSNEGEKLNKLLNQHKQLIEKEEKFYESIIAENKTDLNEIENRISSIKSENEKIENENKELETVMGVLAEFLNDKLDTISNVLKVRMEEKANLEREKVLLLEEKLKSQQTDFNKVFESCLENSLANIDEHIRENISKNKENQHNQLLEIENIFKQYDVSPAIVNLKQSNLAKTHEDTNQQEKDRDEDTNRNENEIDSNNDDDNEEQNMEYKQFDNSIDSKDQVKENGFSKNEETNSKEMQQFEVDIDEHDQNILDHDDQNSKTNNEDNDTEENKLDTDVLAQTNQSAPIIKDEEHAKKAEEEANKPIQQEELDDLKEIDNKSTKNIDHTNSNDLFKSDEPSNNDFDNLSINDNEESRLAESNPSVTSPSQK